MHKLNISNQGVQYNTCRTKYLHQDIDMIPKKILVTGPLKTIRINKRGGGGGGEHI